MAKYYEVYKTLIVATTLSGIYCSSIEKIYGSKWYIKLLKLLFILPAIVQPVYFIATIKYLLFDEDETGNKLYGITIGIYAFFSTFMAYSFYFNIKEFERVFELWDSMFQDELFPEDREEKLRKNRKVTNGWLRIFGGLSILSPIIYCTITYLNPDKKLGHPSGIPYESKSPDFELISTLDLIESVFGFSLLVTYDSMTMVFLSLEEAQFLHLKDSLAQIIDIVSESSSGEVRFNSGKHLDETTDESDVLLRAFEKVDKKIRIWISHHIQLLRFHDELQKIYHSSLSVKFMVFVMIICLCSFLAVTGQFTSKDVIMSTAFCCNYYALFYVNIIFADSVRTVAASIFEEAFGKCWYIYPPRLKSTFHIILMRSQRPVQYFALKLYPLSSRSFLRIMSSAYSFFTFLLQVNRNRSTRPA